MIRDAQAVAHALVIRSVRKPALGTTDAAVVVVEPAGDATPLVVPIARVKRRLELELLVTQQRIFIVRDRKFILFVVLAHEDERLAGHLFHLSRVGVLTEDDSEVWG